MKVLLIHNRFRWAQPITWLSLFIRVFTCSKWNHIAIEQGGKVYESVAKGVNVQHFDKWVSKSDRLVQELIVPEERVKAEVYAYLGKPYGAFDLLRIGYYTARVKWFGLDSEIPHNSRGFVCSELAATVLGMDNPHLVTPADFAHMGLEKGLYYQTFKV